MDSKENQSDSENSIKILKQRLNELKRFDSEFLSSHIDPAQATPSSILRRLITSIKNLENEVGDLTELLENNSPKPEYLLGLSILDKSADVDLYSFMSDVVRDAIILINSDLKVIQTNKATNQIFKVKSNKKLTSIHLKELLGASLFKKLTPHVKTAFKNHSDREIYSTKLDNGKEIWLEIDCVPYEFRDNETYVVLVMRNITDRKTSENIAKNQELYLEKVNDAVFILDQKCRIHYWNKGSEKTFGWSKKEALGAYAKDLVFRHSDKEQLAYTVDILKNKTEWECEQKITSKNNEELIVNSQWSHYEDAAQDLKGYLVVNTDITERKNMELQIYRAQRVESIGALTSGIAHDLNNVLSLFFLSVRALKPKIKDTQGKTILHLLENSAQRGVGLVRQILDFARGVDGKKEEVLLEDLITELKDFMSKTFPKNLKANIKFEEYGLMVYGSPTQLHQVLLNLFVNAKDAMEPKGGNLTVTVSREKLTNRKLSKLKFSNSIEEGQYICISIEDCGNGIQEDVLEKMFTPFFTTKEIGKGTGLGLSTVISLVKNHKGALDVASVLHKGTVFKIYLPEFEKT